MNDSPLVNFRGPWSPDEQDLIEAAARDAETKGMPSCAEDVSAPWMAIRTGLDDKILYAASRLHVEDGLLAQSAADLAARIRRLAEHETEAVEEPGHRPFFQLAYESTATDAMTEDDLQDILRQARAKNDELDITGLLLHAQGQFFQVLEGPESAVRDLYATIRDDPRHKDVETLHATRVAERTFPEWKMALENLAVVAGEEGVSPFLQTGELPVESPPMNGLLGAIERFRQAATGTEQPGTTEPPSVPGTPSPDPSL